MGRLSEQGQLSYNLSSLMLLPELWLVSTLSLPLHQDLEHLHQDLVHHHPLELPLVLLLLVAPGSPRRRSLSTTESSLQMLLMSMDTRSLMMSPRPTWPMRRPGMELMSRENTTMLTALELLSLSPTRLDLRDTQRPEMSRRELLR